MWRFLGLGLFVVGWLIVRYLKFLQRLKERVHGPN
jgi:hypothetical protein